ncbi:BPTI/Kunitz domain-containing protein 4-like [Liolophura sinensis]|uniref:BPTI/Kunitz domain-containing protein 4-like n=1 Tax=Liolophura sinensis TaxID=3198878 RepID=UPI00315961EA
MKVLIIAACLIGAIYAANLQIPVCGPVCMIYCPYGNVLDSKGCPTCSCNPAPLEKREDGCPPVLCKMYCFNGWKKNDEGCDICECA